MNKCLSLVDLKAVQKSLHGEILMLVDTHGYVVEWNDETEKVYGYKSQELSGMHFSNFFNEVEKVVGGSQFLRWALNKGRYENECEMIGKNGEIFLAKNLIMPLYTFRNIHNGFLVVTSLSPKK